jgi:hypothetical protein
VSGTTGTISFQNHTNKEIIMKLKRNSIRQYPARRMRCGMREESEDFLL